MRTIRLLPFFIFGAVVACSSGSSSNSASSVGANCSAYVDCCKQAATDHPEIQSACDQMKSSIDNAQKQGGSTASLEDGCKTALTNMKQYCDSGSSSSSSSSSSSGSTSLGPSCTAYVGCCKQAVADHPELQDSCSQMQSSFDTAQKNGTASSLESGCKSALDSLKSAGSCQ